MFANIEPDNIHYTSIPLGSGLKYFIKCSNFSDLYLGFGSRYYFAKENIKSPYFSNNNLNGLGFVCKTGYWLKLKYLFLDFFVDYSYKITKKRKNVRTYKSKINLGGVAIGAGIGTNF